MIKNEEEKSKDNISNNPNISLRDIINCIISFKEETPSRPYIKRIIDALNKYEPENKFETIRFITRDEYGKKYDGYSIYTVKINEKTGEEYLDESLMWHTHKNVFPHIEDDLKNVVELSNKHYSLNSEYITSYIIEKEDAFSKTNILYDDFLGEGYISYASIKPFVKSCIYIGNKVYRPEIYGENNYNVEDINNFLNMITVNIDDWPANLKEKLSKYSQSQKANKVKKIGKIN